MLNPKLHKASAREGPVHEALSTPEKNRRSDDHKHRWPETVAVARRGRSASGMAVMVVKDA